MKTYKSGVQALKGIDLEINSGDFFALLGPNGAGKSTTIGILSSLVTKTSGEVYIQDVSIDKDKELAKRYLGVVPQEFNFGIFETVENIVINQGGYYGLPTKVAKERAEVYLNKLGLWEKRKSASGKLSGGMKRRLMIARALVHEPPILILDEPTAGVDIEIRRSMWDFLLEKNETGTTIILTTHYLEEAETLCRNVAIIDKGKISINTDMKSLLRTLDKETFSLDIKEKIKTLPKSKKFKYVQVDERTIELSLTKRNSLNEAFQELNKAGIQIVSLRNKTNRLEELFLKLVEKNT